MRAGIVVGIDGKIAVKGKRPEVVDAANMVVMLMSDEDSIKRL